MSITGNPYAVAYKHNNASGIGFKENLSTGLMELIEWPDSIPYPTQTDLDTWEVEWDNGQPLRDLASLRTERNALLAESDWTQYNDSPLTDEAKAEWATYRQELRDLPASTEDPANPTWPEAPE